MEADQLGRLRDILESARLIATYVRDVSEAAFQSNSEKQDAVVRRIENIGEATAHLSEATRAAIPELPFRKMRGMRNIVARLRQCGCGHRLGSRDDLYSRGMHRVGAVLRRTPERAAEEMSVITPQLSPRRAPSP
jgi:uncharacterized protein with HEPN domain